MNTRRATLEELAAHLSTEIRFGGKVMFRHFIVESADSRTATGVRHKRYGKSKVTMIDGRPHVRHHGKIEALTATWCGGCEGVRPFVTDVRLDSPYL